MSDSDSNDNKRPAAESVAAYQQATLAIRSGYQRSHEAEHSEAMFLTSSYVFDNAELAAKHFSNELQGNVYSRYTNPTVRAFEERLAAMEGAEQAVATSSGMAATLSVVMSLLQSGDHILCSTDVFGSTRVMLNNYIVKFGVQVSYVSLTDLDAWQQAIQPNTKMLFCETPSNPMSEVADLEALAALSKKAGALFVVDNCFCTPALQKPLQWGADIVVHSATKYLDGQGRCLGGAVVGNSELMEKVVGFLRAAGPTMSPFNAWVFLKGLETLRIRMQAHSANAAELASWLQKHPKVTKVFYAGLEDHPGHSLAKKQQSDFGGVVSFAVVGGREQAWAVIDNTRMLSLTANLGDTKTTIVHPATTTHGRLSDEERQQAGIGENLIRIAVGLEDIVDIKNDLQLGLDAI
ncbi:O-succinylhomoserine sulfhydrylase [Porticoccaceae bacterium]|nr:O-succinylhomoserine sulfhydrylase [Porticoccaceae bacterium]MDB9736970.1 O-succinylhomoserine sulfhydrylase [Porticoccaceae bacterium]MDB9793074.1 O-succinylhomoserine sulfhydrylase [bacterium]MDB9948677.1 O-succinylhomoserine sulfhydrylase [Porticoccaceae bacterium]